MRTSEVTEKRGEPGLATKLEAEAAAWRKSRPAREKFSRAGVQVVRIPKRRLSSTAANAGVCHPLQQKSSAEDHFRLQISQMIALSGPSSTA
jgi:hypothetical protein